MKRFRLVLLLVSLVSLSSCYKVYTISQSAKPYEGSISVFYKRIGLGYIYEDRFKTWQEAEEFAKSIDKSYKVKE